MQKELYWTWLTDLEMKDENHCILNHQETSFIMNSGHLITIVWNPNIQKFEMNLWEEDPLK